MADPARIVCPHCGEMIVVVLTTSSTGVDETPERDRRGFEAFNFSTRLTNCLSRAGLLQAWQWAALPDQYLIKLKHLGFQSLRELRRSVPFVCDPKASEAAHQCYSEHYGHDAMNNFRPSPDYMGRFLYRYDHQVDDS